MRLSAISIFILSSIIRIYKLNLVPLNHDEAVWLLPVADKFNKFIPITPLRGYSHLFLGYLVFFSKKIFSSPIYILRIPSAITGVATVILTYQLAKDMYGKKTGLVSALLLSLLPWHVIQSRVGIEPILTPFFGCLIFITLLNSIYKKSNVLFMCSWGFLGIGAFYTYRASLPFIPIFVLSLLILRKEFNWLKPKIVIVSVLFFLILLYPLIHLHIFSKINLLGHFYHSYHKSPFKGNIFMNIFTNLKTNGIAAFKSLFLVSRGSILYGASIQAPLLISKISLLIIPLSFFASVRRRNTMDKVLLLWLGIGLFSGLMGISYFQPRHIISTLIPLVILIGKLIAEIFSYAKEIVSLKRISLFLAGTLLCAGLVSTEIFQLWRYYKTAPSFFEECRRNSYGCSEAAQFLAQSPDIENSQIVMDVRMIIYIYLKCRNIFFEDDIQYIYTDGSKMIYYVIWAPESHPNNYWAGFFRKLYDSFRQNYPNETPIKTIYYPNGIPAIYIFRVRNNEVGSI